MPAAIIAAVEAAGQFAAAWLIGSVLAVAAWSTIARLARKRGRR